MALWYSVPSRNDKALGLISSTTKVKNKNEKERKELREGGRVEEETGGNETHTHTQAPLTYTSFF